MKKAILVFLAIGFMATMFAAEITPYGSARLGYWYENLSKENSTDGNVTGKSFMRLNYALQGNSRLGVKFKNDALTGQVEYGAKDGTANVRLLWGKYDFGTWALLFGQDYTGFNEYASQVYGGDNDLIGYGAADEGRQAQVRVEMKTGLYFALIKPALVDPSGYTGTGHMKNVMMPKINVGYKMNMGNLYFHPTFGFNTYSYNKEGASADTITYDHSVTSWILGLTAKSTMDAISIKGHLNYGQNIKNYGISTATNNGAYYTADDNKVNDVSTLGLFVEGSYKMNDTMTPTIGLGMVSSSNSDWDKSDGAMAIFAQLNYKMNKSLCFIPEIGIQDRQKNAGGDKEGSLFYFGTQMRVDF